MTQGPMTLAESVRKISTAAAKMAVHRQAAEASTSFDVADQHWEAYETEGHAVFALTGTPEGQEALKELEKMALIFADLGVAMAEADPPYVWVGDRI